MVANKSFGKRGRKRKEKMEREGKGREGKGREGKRRGGDPDGKYYDTKGKVRRRKLIKLMEELRNRREL